MMVESVVDSLRFWIARYGVQIIATVLVAIIIVVGKILVNRFWNRSVVKGLIPDRIGNLLKLLMNVISFLLFFVITSAVWAVEGTWIIGTFGLSAGTVLGFASSETVGNAVAGFVILLSRPFEVGHRIKIDSHLGNVKKIDLIYTTVVTSNLEEVNIPNRKVLLGEIVNYGMRRPIRVPVSCTVDYGVGLEEVKQKLLQIPEQVDGVAMHPRPFVRVTNLGNFAVELTLYVFTVDSRKIFQLEADLKERIWRMAQMEGISLATPHLIQSISAKNTTPPMFDSNWDFESALEQVRLREKLRDQDQRNATSSL